MAGILSSLYKKKEEEVKELKIDEGVTKVSKENFSSSLDVTSITLPSTLKEIDEEAFMGLNKLKEINIPSVSFIPQNAFTDCTKLQKITLPPTLKRICAYSFYNCGSLEEINIPDTVESIDSYAFYGCKKLKKISLPSSLTYLGSFSFSMCSMLENINIPEGLEVINENTFSFTSLKNIDIKDNVYQIKKEAFKGCKSLIKVVLPQRLEEISPSLFEDCRGLIECNIPHNVSVIGKDAFLNCTSLTSLFIPQNINVFHTFFRTCKALSNIEVDSENESFSFEDNALFDKKSGEIIFISKNIKGRYSIPENVERISNNAFFNCSNIEEIYIPSSLKRISTDCLSNLKSLKAIDVSDENPYFSSENGLLFDKEKKYLLCCPRMKEGNVILPKSVNNIPRKILEKNKNVKFL